MFKLAAIIGGVLLMAGVALAGTMTSLDSTNSPTVGTAPPPATSTARQDDRGQENELRGRENEPEKICAAPATSPSTRTTRAAPARGAARRRRRPADDRGRDHNSGPGGGHEDNSCHSGGGTPDTVAATTTSDHPRRWASVFARASLACCTWRSHRSAWSASWG